MFSLCYLLRAPGNVSFGSLGIFDISRTDTALLRNFLRLFFCVELDMSIIQNIHRLCPIFSKSFSFPTHMSTIAQEFPHSVRVVQDRIVSPGNVLGKMTLLFLPDKVSG